MKQPTNRNQGISLSARTQVVIAVILLAITALVCIALFILWFPQIFPKQTAQVAPTPPPTSGISTILVPTPDCGPPTLVIGSTKFQIQTIQLEPDGSLIISPGATGIAYWVNGTNTNYIFVLSPTIKNLALQTTLITGDLATIFWADCTAMSFSISAIEAGQLRDPALFDQAIPGITVFVQTDSSNTGFLIKGELPEETVSVLDTPMPDESGILAEVSLLETSTSPDGTMIKIGISIRNYGQTAFTLSPGNISLAPQDSTALAIISSEPSLPKEIGPEVTETFYFTFPRPSAQIVTLKIFTVEYDIEGY